MGGIEFRVLLLKLKGRTFWGEKPYISRKKAITKGERSYRANQILLDPACEKKGSI